jgi:flavin reductase (DIM6/NTAB) family NADH-FMN oxidoreductase RutF
MNRMECRSVIEQALKQIEKGGAFLTVKCCDEINTMTIGWAMFGIVWQKPILMITVRPIRHTFSIIEKINNFTLSVPSGGMEEELMFCGTQSGRDRDKIKECNLKIREGQIVESPVIQVDGIHFECRIVFKTTMDPINLVEAYEKFYPGKDYHTLYFGEILDCYTLP